MDDQNNSGSNALPDLQVGYAVAPIFIKLTKIIGPNIDIRIEDLFMEFQSNYYAARNKHCALP